MSESRTISLSDCALVSAHRPAMGIGKLALRVRRRPSPVVLDLVHRSVATLLPDVARERLVQASQASCRVEADFNGKSLIDGRAASPYA